MEQDMKNVESFLGFLTDTWPNASKALLRLNRRLHRRRKLHTHGNARHEKL